MDDFFGSGVQKPCPAIVAKPFPCLHDLAFAGLCQVVHRREFFHEGMPTWHASLHSGLLQHDFTQPRSVDTRRCTPGQIALDLRVPSLESAFGRDGRVVARKIFQISRLIHFVFKGMGLFLHP